ncbi:MmgE/PrpD family protein [Trinickia mobilis]|uniref:MmgE/PrpD family protein n=1 Tax=Trinickia mobilis TaxID=2816356 RepID=UPI001A8CEE5B|nr:MmgE/PrpD family protein [Trinickia mobilis]
MTQNPPSLAGQLAAFVAATPAGALPAEVAHKAVRHVLDTFGAALAGARALETRCALELVARQSGGAAAWGTPYQLTARDAAFVNGVAAHALELDDSGGCDHSGAVVLPAALAALSCTSRPVPGRELLTAVVLGYDVARRVLEAAGGYSAHNGAGWHSTLTCGVFGAAAASARVLGLDAAQTGFALGHAASFAGGLWGFIHDASQTKRLHAGRAAEGGLLAALFARKNVSGPAQVFADVWGGFFNTFAPQTQQPGLLLDGLGQNWKIMRCSIKPHASCRSAHAAVDSMLMLTRGLTYDAADVRGVHVRLSGFVNRMCGARDLGTLAAAQMSLPYALAAALVFGDTGIDAYRAERRADPRIAAMLARITLEVDPAMADLDEPEVTLAAGGAPPAKQRVLVPLGSPGNPVSDDALLKKFQTLAGMVLSEPAVNALADAVLGIESCADARAFEPLVLGAADSRALLC